MNFCKNQQFFRLKESTIFFMKIINFIPLISHMCTCVCVKLKREKKEKKENVGTRRRRAKSKPRE